MPFDQSKYGRVVVLAILTALVAGCSRGLERVAVKGQVTFDGQPVQRGRIRFLPDSHTEAPMSGAEITDGQYTVAQGGVPVGTHRVEIEAFRVGTANDDPNIPPTLGRQFLPARYNRESDLRFTAPSGSDPLTKDFHLTK